jgi:hypothetical protein
LSRAREVSIHESVKLRTSTIDLIAAEFARATADGDPERAEGWLATAMLVAAREADPSRTRRPLRRWLRQDARAPR